MSEQQPKSIVWLGDSLKRVREFPSVVRQDIGASLFDVQQGSTPDGAKPMKGIGSGVFEIVTRFDTDTYRTVYAVQIGKRVYILPCISEKITQRDQNISAGCEFNQAALQTGSTHGKGERIMTIPVDTNIPFVEGSENVFADLALDNADELLLRAQLGYSVRQLLLRRSLNHDEIATLLDITLSDTSDLMQGKYYLFSEGRLCKFLNCLNQKVVIQISQHQEGEPLQQVAISS